MATALDPALTKKTFNNWLKGALAVLFTREGLTEFVKVEISDFQRDLLQTIFTKNGIPVGTTCSSCTTANMLRCPTQEFCDKRGKCKLHDPTVPNKNPNQKCPKNICHNVKDAINKHHRFLGPSWHISDATRWCSDSFQIAKCYLPPKGYDNKSSFDEIDFNGTLGVIINNTRFQNQMSAQTNISCSKVRDMVNENIRHSARYEMTDIDLARCIDALQDLLQDSKYLLHDQHAQDAVNKLNQLQNNTLVITAGDITKVLDEDISKRISEKQQEAIQSILNHLAKVQEASVASLVEILEKRDTAIKAIQKEAKQQIKNVKNVVAETDNVLFKDLKEEIITFYRENESQIPAAPLVEEHKVPLEDLYVTPLMWAYDNPYYFGAGIETQKQQQKSDVDAQKRHKATVSELFLSDNQVRFKKIFITANAGFGKTSLSQKLTMTWCQSHSPLTSLTDKYEDKELDAMKYFDFLFLLHLRDYQSEPLCNLDDLIMQMLSNNLSRNTLYKKEFLQRLLHEKRCLIILDGLDEWAHPEKCRRTPAVPHNNHIDSCTVLTTSRPWKLGTIGLSEHNIDRHIEISEMDWWTRQKLEQNAARILNERKLNLTGKRIADFDEEVRSVEIGVIIYIPYIMLQLMCSFFGGLPIGKSKCQVYSNITEFTLERGLVKKDLPNIHVQSHDNYVLPNCMKENETCKRYYNLLIKLGKFAFYTLFSKKKESCLIFDRKIVTQYMTEQEIEFCLKVGFLCQTKDSSIIAVKRYQIFFQHKSVQEFFSAIYITSEWQNESVKSITFQVCSSLSSTLEMENLFVFVCGMNPEVYTCISGEVQKIGDLDSVMRSSSSEMPLDHDDWKPIKSYVSMQMQCLQESMRNGNESCPINLYVVIDSYDYEYFKVDFKTAFHTIIPFNKSQVKSLIVLTYPDQKTPAFLKSVDPCVFTSLEKLKVVDSDKEPVWLADILTVSASTLNCLTLSGYKGSLSAISMTALTRLTCLQSLDLLNVHMSYDNLSCLYAKISQITTLTQLKLNDIIWDHRDSYVRKQPWSKYLDRGFGSLDLHRLDKLKMLRLSRVSYKELHVNLSCLEKLEFWPQKDQLNASATLLLSIRGAPVLSSLTLTEMSLCQELKQTIESLTELRYLKLESIDMRDVRTPSPDRKQTKRAEPVIVKTCFDALRKLLLSVDGLQHPVTLELTQCRGPYGSKWHAVVKEIETTPSLSQLNQSYNTILFSK